MTVRQTYTYDAEGNPTSQNTELPAPPLLNLGNPAIGAATNLTEGRNAYCYDNAGRLTR